MKMKKLVSLVLVAACTLSLAACGGNSDSGDESTASEDSGAVTAKVIDVDTDE